MAQVLRRMEVISDRSDALRAHPLSWTDARLLTAATAEAHAVPTFTDAGGNTVKARYVVFSSTLDFYAVFNATAGAATAAVPAADITNGTSPILNPTVRYLGSDVAEISLIAAAATIVTMEFFV